MAMTDPIADMLTRIRNANSAYHEKRRNPCFEDESCSARHPQRERFRQKLRIRKRRQNAES